MSSRYFINKVFIAAFSIFLLGNNVFASPTWYGKIFVDAQSFSNDVMGTKTDIKNNSSRPMFQDATSFEKLLKQRESIYYEADFVVKTDYKTPEKIASEISLLID